MEQVRLFFCFFVVVFFLFDFNNLNKTIPANHLYVYWQQ